MKPMNDSKIKLYINESVYMKMHELIKQCSKEIAWHGYIKRISDTVFYWYDIIMYPQYVTGTTTLSNEDEYANWLNNLLLNDDNFTELRLHGHSHVNMGCTPSGTDVQYRNDLLSKIKREDDFYIFLIANKRSSHSLEIFDFKTRRVLDTNDVSIIIGNPEVQSEAAKWAATQIEQYVKEDQPCSTTSNLKSFSTHKYVQHPYTLSDAEQWADPLLR